MFYNCKSLEKIPDISNWNFNQVKNMSFMFFGCEKIKEIPKKFNDENFIKDKDVRYFKHNCINLKEETKFFREIKNEGKEKKNFGKFRMANVVEKQHLIKT